MSEKIPQVTPDQIIQTYLKEGRAGLVKVFCVFDSKPILNKIMGEMVDCQEMLLTGKMSINKFLEEMEFLNQKFYEAVTDVALDEFIGKNISKDHLTECLDELQSKKAKCDLSQKNSK